MTADENPERAAVESREQDERTAQIPQRLAEIRIRLQQLREPASGRSPSLDPHQADQRRRQALLNAAAAHDRAAEQHQRCVTLAIEPIGHHRERAAWHQRAAAQDRQAASQVF